MAAAGVVAADWAAGENSPAVVIANNTIPWR